MMRWHELPNRWCYYRVTSECSARKRVVRTAPDPRSPWGIRYLEGSDWVKLPSIQPGIYRGRAYRYGTFHLIGDVSQQPAHPLLGQPAGTGMIGTWEPGTPEAKELLQCLELVGEVEPVETGEEHRP